MADISSIKLPDGSSYNLKDNSKVNQTQLATVETGTTASKAYAIGDYFVWNNLLYQVIAAISSGGTLTANTNCVAVTVTDQLKGLYYGTCSTGGSTKAKTTTISGINSYYDGLSVIIVFAEAQMFAGTPTLNINNLGAKNIVRNGTTHTAGQYEWKANEAVQLLYNNGVFKIVDGSVASTTYYGYTKLSSAVNSTSDEVAATPAAVKLAYDLASEKADQTTIAPVEITTTATVTHGLGSIFYLNNILYRALEDIDIGDTINTGLNGNAVETSVARSFIPIQTLTSAEYALLSQAEIDADIIYIITNDAAESASDVSFNNTGTTLSASTVQDAITEVSNEKLPMYGMGKNLLDNWYFVGGGSQTGVGTFPINQRGQSQYTTAGYTIDRWTNQRNNTISLESDGLKLTYATAQAYQQIYQFIENYQELKGKTVTFSALLENTSPCYLRIVYGSTASESILSDQIPANSSGLFKVTGTIPNSATTLAMQVTSNLLTPNSGYFKVKAVKLELGTQQTLAHLEGSTWILNELPNYEEELIKCQTSTADSSDIYANKVMGVNVSNKNLLDNWYFLDCINKRGKPSYSGEGYSIDRWYLTGGVLDISSVNGATFSCDTQNKSFRQTIRNASTLLSGKILTVSVLYGDNQFISACFTWPSSGTVQITSFSGVQLEASSTMFLITRSANGSNEVALKAIKLELGTQQTLAHLEGTTWVLNDVFNYQEELIKCQTSTADYSDIYANQIIGMNVVNPNLLDNWYFMQSQTIGGQLPINQRYFSSSGSTAAYTIDRWATFDGSGTVSLSADGITLTCSTNQLRWGQQIPIWKISGKTVTLSVLLKTVTGGLFSSSFGESTGAIINSYSMTGNQGISVSSAGLYSITCTPTYNSSSGSITNLANILFKVSSGASAVIQAAKLEYGSQQTLAHRENGQWVLNEIPDYNEQLERCNTSLVAKTDKYTHKLISYNVPNRNLLDNWYFIGTGSQDGYCKYPINQRGKATYTGSTNICIDRWHLTNSVVTTTLQSTGLRVVTANSLSYSAGIQQKIYASNIPNGVYTLSVLTTTGLNTCQATLDTNDGNWRGGSSTAGCWVAIRYMSGTGTFDFNITARDATIIAAKFEYGNQQTLCHNEGTTASPVWVLNQLPDFREELAKCQYYFWAPKVYGSTEDHGIGYGHAVQTTSGVFYLYLPQMMNPSVTPSFVGSTPRVYRANTNTSANASAVSSIFIDGNIIQIMVTIGTVTIGEGLRLINTRGSIFGISAEI